MANGTIAEQTPLVEDSKWTPPEAAAFIPPEAKWTPPEASFSPPHKDTTWTPPEHDTGEIKAYPAWKVAMDEARNLLNPLIGPAVPNPEASNLEQHGIIGAAFTPTISPLPTGLQAPDVPALGIANPQNVAGVYNAVAPVVNSAVGSPGGIMSMGLGSVPEIGTIIGRSLGYGFGAQAVGNLPEVAATMTNPNISRQGKVEAAASEIMGLTAPFVAHAATKESPVSMAKEVPITEPTNLPVAEQAMQEAHDNPTPIGRTRAFMGAILDPNDIGTGAMIKKLSGEAAPITSSLGEESGNALVRYASANQAADAIAKSYAAQVMGDNYKNPEFASRLGDVLIEDRLQGVKRGLETARDEALNQYMGSDDATVKAKAWQQFTDLSQQVTEVKPWMAPDDFAKALQDPAIQAAIERHKEIVQPVAQQMHTDLGGQLAQPGPNTGAFINLKNVLGDESEIGSGAGRGNLTNPIQKKTRFNQQTMGTGESYENDYNNIVDRMISGNFAETAKRALYDQLQQDGLGQVAAPGEGPKEINGRIPVSFEITRSANRLFVDPRIAPELRQAFNTDGPIAKGGLINAVNTLNRIQLAGPTDAIYHVANIFSSISGSQGGGSFLADVGRAVPGVNIVDTTAKILNRARQVATDSPEIRQQIADLARIGATRPENPNANIGGRFIQLMDTSARLVRNDMFDNLVKRNLVPDTESNRREFINKIGNYNPRLATQFQRFMKDAGISPFVVAGRNFNRLGAQRISLSPGVEAASTKAALQMRAVELARLMATMVAVPMTVNMLTTGHPLGRSGTPMGAIDLGKNTADGKMVTIDPAQWTGYRRGLRITGLNALANDAIWGKTSQQTIGRSLQDVVGGALHPWTGPTVTAGTTLMTGYSPSGYRQAAYAKKGQSQFAMNAAATAEHLNPFIAASLQGYQDHKGDWSEIVPSATQSLAGAAGIKEVKPPK